MVTDVWTTCKLEGSLCSVAMWICVVSTFKSALMPHNEWSGSPFSFTFGVWNPVMMFNERKYFQLYNFNMGRPGSKPSESSFICPFLSNRSEIVGPIVKFNNMWLANLCVVFVFDLICINDSQFLSTSCLHRLAARVRQILEMLDQTLDQMLDQNSWSKREFVQEWLKITK